MSFKPKKLKYIHDKVDGITYDDEVTVVIDGDILAFKAASAIETRFINVTHTKTNKTKRFDNRTAFYGRGKNKDGGWLAKINSKRKKPFTLGDFTIEDDREVEDISHAFHIIKSMVDTTCERCKTSKYEIYLEEGKNFRNYVCTAFPYKGNRSGMIKPILLKEVRTYMEDHFAAKVIKGDPCLETDDMCAIRATEGYKDYLEKGKCTTIQSSLDKDSLSVAGLNFNIDKMEEPLFIEGYGETYLDTKGKLRGHGKKWLFSQMLMGDKIDNILPSKLSGKKFGDKGTFKVLENTNTFTEGLQAVVNKYKEWYPEPIEYEHCFTGEKLEGTWLSLASEFFILLYMRETEDDDTTFTKLLKENNIEY